MITEGLQMQEGEVTGPAAIRQPPVNLPSKDANTRLRVTSTMAHQAHNVSRRRSGRLKGWNLNLKDKCTSIVGTTPSNSIGHSGLAPPTPVGPSNHEVHWPCLRRSDAMASVARHALSGGPEFGKCQHRAGGPVGQYSELGKDGSR